MGRFVGKFGNLKRIQVYMTEEEWQEFEDYAYRYYEKTIQKDNASYSRIAKKLINAGIKIGRKDEDLTWIDEE